MLAAARQRRGHEDRVSQGQDLDAKSRKGLEGSLGDFSSCCRRVARKKRPSGGQK